MTSFLEKANSEYGYSVNEQFRRASEALSQYEGYDSRYTDDQYDRWRERIDQNEKDEASISDMFDGLRGR